ncbi:cytoplasmic protein [Gigaspora margarita]|uniref:Cytoplasmic protein n=1 Tax=Gigaspora margarita TaxID=4874 RepID=A0A8H3ZZP0_GIGMA|nr:cytoplasmic protein [Gigaspora margarita]
MKTCFKWDNNKAASNLRKHGVSFEAAAQVFEDPFAISIQDQVENGEERWKTIGMSAKQKAELKALAKMPDDTIDYSDIPPLTDEQLANAVRGRFYKPIKEHVTVRLDSDVLRWLKASGKGYQGRLRAILRNAMLKSLHQGE